MGERRRLSVPRPKRHQAILEAACAEFARRGFERGNVNTIAEAVGVGKGTLYNYFDSKEDLFLRSVEYAAGQVIAHLKMHVPRTAPAPERMRAFVMADLSFMDEHRDEYMLMAAMFYGANFLYGTDGTYTQVAMAAYREFFAMIEDICGAWMGEQAVSARGGRVLAFQVLALIEAANLYTEAADPASLDRRRDVERIMEMLTRGLGTVKEGS
jgi:AcrR family transcriptional regulator